VFLYVDYRMPIKPLREELERILEHAPEWDGRVQVLQVTDATDRAVQLRALVSSFDSALNWDLRCRVREGLVNFVQAAYPHYLPRARADLSSDQQHIDLAPPLERTGSAPPTASTVDTAADPVASRGERSGPDPRAHAAASTASTAQNSRS
jgi:hypothetical protein